MTDQIRPVRVILGVCGSVAAFKAQELCRLLIHQGAEVQVILTSGACQFVTPLSFQALSGRQVKTDLFDPASEDRFGHIELARWADLVLVAPASADLLAKASLGLADDFLSTLLLATQAPIYFAPAMNVAMWDHPATQGHIKQLSSRGAVFIEPATGVLACGEEGAGKLADLADILEPLPLDLAASQPLKGKQVLVTAGPTTEPIDPVRFITNRSSGKMGFALATAAQRLGAEVTLISGPVHLATPKGVKRIDIETAAQMQDAVLAAFLTTHLTIKCAAVGDFRVAQPRTEKLKKSDQLNLELKANPDILAQIGEMKQDWQVLVGFAAETQHLAEHSKEKRERKQADWIIGNDVSEEGLGFDSERNQVLILSAGQEISLGPAPKKVLAFEILQQLLRDPVLGPKLTA